MPEKNLVKIHPGCGPKSCVEAFKQEYTDFPLKTYLLVPTERLKRDIENTLLKEEIAVVEKAVSTPLAFASATVEKIPGHRLISEEEAKMILLKAARKNSSYAGALSPSKDFSSRLLNDLYGLVKVATEQEADYRQVFSRESPKNRAIARVIEDYAEIIRSEKLIPPERIWTTATEHIKEKGFSGETPTFFFSGIYEPFPAVKSFITACSSKSRKCVYFMPFCENRKVCTDNGKWFGAKTTTAETVSACDYTVVFSGGNPAGLTADIFAKRYDNFKSEISGIAAEISRLVKSGVKPSEIAVAFPDPAGATAVADEIFSDFGLSFSSSATFPLSRSPIVQSVILTAEVIAKKFSKGAVSEFLASPYLASERLLPAKKAFTDTVAENARIDEGFSSWEKNLEKYIDSQKKNLLSEDLPNSKKKDLEKKITDARYVLKNVVPVLSELNDLSHSDTYRGHIKNFTELLKKWKVPVISGICGEKILSRDKKDLEDLKKLLKGLSKTSETSGEDKVPFYEFSRLLSSSAGSTRIPLERDDSKIQVSGIQGLQDTGFSYVFLAGLVDGKIPDIPGILPYTTDEEDQKIWPGKKRDKVRGERFYFVKALYAGRRAVYLSCHNEAEGRQEIPSQFYETASGILAAKEPKDPGRKGPVSYSLEETGRSLSKGIVCDDFYLPEGISPESVMERINTEGFFRRGLYDSAYDGLLSGDDDIKEALNERFGGKYAYSPTSLEIYSQCPFRFYLKHVLGLNPPPKTDFALSAADRGDLLHKTLFSFYSEWMKNHERPPSGIDRDEALSLLKSCAGENIEAYGMQGPAWDSMTKEILGETGYGKGILEKFADEEVKLYPTGFVPKYFEAGFGSAGPGNSFSDGPVEITSKSGKSIFLRGFVDRIDVRDGDFVITDYKTGNNPKYRDIASGKALQLPLYLKAAEKSMDMRGIGGFYYKLSKKEVFRRAELYDPDEEELFSAFQKARIKKEPFEDILDRSVEFACSYSECIRKGIFTPAKETGVCPGYCEFKNLCRFSEFRILEQENILNGPKEKGENPGKNKGDD
ncbi:hypothetical protein J2128_002297 [Methanomicrobium sp. W14]|uniref:PD-(D/E)XK nuclease family protein n=1 Tax=Methanomicrobium sp. W14 TaxID=2817839 RepID=UPI001AEAFC67|nr:PD-(D/E)XK nuclease family protein [Methanomicrobium sp. W14]MBP2134331.1 hypothetical protein [Methanomicrobium sp. W14]